MKTEQERARTHRLNSELNEAWFQAALNDKEVVSAKRTEERDGRVYTVTVLPDAEPPKNRSKRTRYRFEDVNKPGNLKRRRRHKRA